MIYLLFSVNHPAAEQFGPKKQRSLRMKIKKSKADLNLKKNRVNNFVIIIVKFLIPL